MNRAEQQVHIAIMDYLRAVLPSPAMCWHPANEGKRGKVEAGVLKRMGLLSGVPDIVVMAPHRTTVFLEVKVDADKLRKQKRTVESEEQLAFAENARAMGFTIATVRSIDDARMALRAAGVRVREVTP